MVVKNRLTEPANGKPPDPPPTDGQSPVSDTSVKVITPDDVVEQVKQIKAKCFENQHGKNYIWMPAQTPSPHWECLPLDSKKFLTRLDELCQSTPAVLFTETMVR